MEQFKLSSVDGNAAAQDKWAQLEAECAESQREISDMKWQAQQLLQRYVDLEAQAASLTSLYVSCHRLHTCLSRDEVLTTVQEIIVNLIGCEQFALFELSRERRDLMLLKCLGIDPAPFRRVDLGKGVIGRVVVTGELFKAERNTADILTVDERDLTACVPLKLRREVTGAIALFRLLPHRSALGEFDRELLEVLQVHVAPALAFAERSGCASDAGAQS